MRRANLAELALVLAVALAAALALRAWVVTPYLVPSGSMVPALRPGDLILVSRLPYAPHRGDVVVFTSPRGSGEVLVKRLIGLPGDNVQMRAGRLILNGETMPCAPSGWIEDASGLGPVVARACVETLPNGRGYTVLKVTADGFANNTPRYTVPPGDLFLLGDNRDDSEDSRFLDGPVGYVPERDVIGRAVLALAPWRAPRWLR